MTRVPDASVVAQIVLALDSPSPPTREWWARAYHRTEAEIDHLFDLAHDERNSNATGGIA